MGELTHIIDPDGEVILVLKDANPPFAVWPDERNEGEKSKVSEASSQDSSSDEDAEEKEKEEEKEEEGGGGEEECFRIRVSAKHLTLASPVFRSLLLGGWKESSTFLQKGSTELTVSSWDLEAFLVFLRIIHCRNKEVPRKVGLELFAKIAVLADYYACKNAMGFFADVWISDIERTIPSVFSRDRMLWLCISWVFQLSEHFKQSTYIIIKSGTIRISSLGLPLPAKLINDLNEERERSIQSVIAALQEQRSILLGDTWACTYAFQCTSMMLGGLEKYMFANRLLPEPVPPFIGLAYKDLVNQIRTLKPPKWSDETASKEPYRALTVHTCSSSSRGYDQLKLTMDGIAGLNINYYL